MSEKKIGSNSLHSNEDESAATMDKIDKVILEELVEDVGGKKISMNPLDLVKNVKVSLSVELGKATLTVDELSNLTEGSVVKMDKIVDEPIDLTLDGKVVARGALVAVDDVFGIQVTEIYHQ